MTDDDIVNMLCNYLFKVAPASYDTKKLVAAALQEVLECETPKKLTKDELIALPAGTPVWTVSGDGDEQWMLRTKYEDGSCANCEYFTLDGKWYGMKGDDKYGLHYLGWFAYLYRPRHIELYKKNKENANDE